MANPAVVVQFIAETSKLLDGVKDVQKQGEGMSKSLSKINWKSIAKWGGAAAAAVGTAKFLKSSADFTTDLAKATLKLQRATNLDAKTASAWVESLKARGIEVDSFTTSLVKLSKMMEKVRTTQDEAARAAKDYNDAAARLMPIIAKGGDAGKEATKELNKWGDAADKASNAAEKAAAPFRAMGVRLADIKKGNVQAVILQLADGFSKLTNPASRAAYAQAFFGRQGQKLLPILMKGSKGINEILQQAEKYGATLSEKTVKSVSKLVDEQRQLKLAQDGVKNQIGQALLPAQVSLYGWLLKTVNALIPLTKNINVMKAALIVATVAWLAYKAAVIASTIAQLGLNAAMLPTIGVAAAIVIGIGALIAAGVLLYKNWDKVKEVAEKVWDAIKRAAMAAINWLKNNWPLVVGILTGPFGLAIAEIIKHWGAIRNAVTSAVNAILNWVRDNWKLLVSILTGPIGAAVVAVATNWDKIENGAKAAVNAIKNAFGTIPAFLRGLVDHFGAIGQALAAALKAPLNAVLRAWNALKIPGFKVKIPGPLPDIKFPGFGFPHIDLLAKGGIVKAPTLAMLGEAGPEAVIPLAGRGGAGPFNVRVYIGETELRGVVRTEVRDENNRVAQVLLAGAR